MPTPSEIHAAILGLKEEFDGTSGNCARFAAVLNRVIGGAGNYLLVDGGHYEYSDHIFLSHEGFLFDSEGMTTWDAVRREYGVMDGQDEDEDDAESDYPEDDAVTLEEFHDPSPDGTYVRKLADDASPLAARWDDADLERALTAAFAGMGVDVTAPSPTSACAPA